MLKASEVSTKVLDHLGLVAAMIHETNIVAIVDKRLPISEEKGAKVTMGERVGAMILNGLGFINNRLYMFSEFLENKPTNLLIREGVSFEHFNDDALGRCLDAIHEYGETKLFSEIALDIGTKLNLLGKTCRLDTTSLSVWGEYENEITERESDPGFKITYGYSKDGQQNLKQMVLNLATTGAGSFPIWMEARSGNASDKEVLHEAAVKMKTLCNQLEDAPSFLFVGDGAIYEKCIQEGVSNLLWLSRVPGTIKKAKEILQIPNKAVAWQSVEGDDRYQICPFKSSYGGIEQRWLLVFSEARYKMETKTLERHIKKEGVSAKKTFNGLERKSFNCSKDAKAAFEEMRERLKYHEATGEIIEVTSYQKKGRPSKTKAQEKTVVYKVKATISESSSKIEFHKSQKGKFILATNQMNKEELSDADMLIEYKNQNKTEQGFRFIKSDTFEVSSVFLTKPSRIQALMMIMTLCLLIYAASELWLRRSLEKNSDTVLSQTKKLIKNPTMEWIYKKFYGIQVCLISIEGKIQEVVSNINSERKRIIRYFGRRAEQIYGLKEVYD